MTYNAIHVAVSSDAPPHRSRVFLINRAGVSEIAFGEIAPAANPLPEMFRLLLETLNGPTLQPVLVPALMDLLVLAANAFVIKKDGSGQDEQTLPPKPATPKSPMPQASDPVYTAICGYCLRGFVTTHPDPDMPPACFFCGIEGGSYQVDLLTPSLNAGVKGRKQANPENLESNEKHSGEPAPDSALYWVRCNYCARGYATPDAHVLPNACQFCHVANWGFKVSRFVGSFTAQDAKAPKNTDTARPIRVQRRRVKGWKMPSNTVYVGRGTKWGNPYRGPDAAEKYRAMFPHGANLGASSEEEALAELRGKNLACYCPLDVPCHADVLLELANR